MTPVFIDTDTEVSLICELFSDLLSFFPGLSDQAGAGPDLPSQ